MTIGEQVRWWGIGLLALILLLALLSNVLTPFLMGAAIAYFTDPLADRLERRGFSRVMATVVITALALVVFTLSLAILTPLVIDQVALAINAAPAMVDSVQTFLEESVLPLMNIDNAEGTALSQALEKFEVQVKDLSVRVLEGVWSLSIAGVQTASLAVITPVVAFYLLLDWDRMIARIDDLLPREHAATIRRLALDVDDVLAGFVRGQLTVCVILGTFYAAGLILVQLPFGLIVGLFAGLISFIPFVGSILGGALSIGIALFHFWNDPIWIAVVAAIFAVGQVVEGNYLSPKMVGDHVGLHPVWLMFSLSAFGALFGFTGLLIAVPTAAVIGVFLRFSLEQYKRSRLYRGLEPPE